MYEVLDGDRIVYISNDYIKTFYFWIDYRNKYNSKAKIHKQRSKQMIVFAAGNKYLVKSIKWNDELNTYEVDGFKFKKHSGTWPKKANIHYIGSHYEEVKDEA